MSATSWFIVGLLAGAAAMLGANLIWRACRQPPGRGRRGLFIGAVAAAAVAAFGGGMLLAADGHRTPSPLPLAAAASLPPVMTGGSAMPSAATMSRMLAAPGAAAAPSAEPMDQAASRLAARLKSRGGTAADWSLLAQAYDFLGRPDDARRARARAAQAGASPAGAPAP